MEREELREIVKNALMKNDNATWLLWEIKNLYRFFEDQDVLVDETRVAIPGDNGQERHCMADTLENLISVFSNIAELDETIYPDDWYKLYDVFDTEVHLTRKEGTWVMEFKNSITGEVFIPEIKWANN